MADQPSGSAPSRRAKTGGVIGQFIFGSEIGKGSFATVFSGKHQSSGGLVAIKCVEIGKLNKKLKENLHTEIRILQKLRHPHIVALFDCIDARTHINLVMEFCELGDLSLFIKKRDKLASHAATSVMARRYPSVPNAGLNEVVVRHFFKQLTNALQFLRSKNLVHRDVKPQNLLLLPGPQFRETHATNSILSASQDSLIPAVGLPSMPMLKLADFGFARVLPSTSMAETLCGSPLYMAPEILRYEQYDAKADLWSVGTVLYEMVSGKPPFRAANHVELLKKIEDAQDQVKFPRDCQASNDMKQLIRSLLKRSAVARLSFNDLFTHHIVTGPTPGLVEDDIALEAHMFKGRSSPRIDEPPQELTRRTSLRRQQQLLDAQAGGVEAGPSSPRERSLPLRSSPLASPAAFPNYDPPAEQAFADQSSREDLQGLGIRRPPSVPSTSAPTRSALHEDNRRRGLSNASHKRYSRDGYPREEYSPPTSALKEYPGKGHVRSAAADEREKAAADIAFEKDYVVVEKKHVEVNAFADQLAAQGAQAQQGSQGGQIVRRATQQGVPTSTTGAVPAEKSKALQIASGGYQRPEHQRRGSYDNKSLPGSPNSATSFISKAIQDASLRWLGVKNPTHFLGKGGSPPQLYNPFPVYPTPSLSPGLITDGRQEGALDEDARVAQYIEDYATRSDCVWGFAEVKYKQLIPMVLSVDQDSGGASLDKLNGDEEEGLTVEAIIVLSEEALVLYVKALSLLAKSMDIASMWWSQKAREMGSASFPRDSMTTQNLITRINSAVQWVRRRFNETLEKAEFVRKRLIDAQKQLPEDHPNHPNNSHFEPASTSTASADGVMLTTGMSAEKLMYDRAVEMSRTAAINEIANEDLPGCELSYATAIRMLEAVLDTDDDVSRQKTLGSFSKSERDSLREVSSEISADDEEAVRKMITMIGGRLSSLKKKINMIANASIAQESHQSLVRKRSGEAILRSVPT